MEKIEKSGIVDFIGDIFKNRGADSYLGEEVTMSQHMLQAAQQAEEADADDAMVGAALLHDIGHYTSEFPDDALELGQNNFHESAGERVLAPYFPKRMLDCIRYHVLAKRYLCAIDTQYHDDLSEASRHSLQLQGGPMNKQEREKFERQPNLDAILQVRRWDDLAKVPDTITPDFDHYRPVLNRLLTVATRGSDR